MAKKVKLSSEALRKADEIIALQGYSSLEEMVEELIAREFEKIKSGDDPEEMAERLSGLGYIS